MRDQEDDKCGDHHLQELQSGGQPEEKAGRPGQDEEECEDSGRHTGETVQEDSDPLDQHQSGDNRKE